MNMTIIPKKLSGAITPPPSKSQAHRMLLGAALAQGESRITGIYPSEDISATMGCVKALGAAVNWDGAAVTITGITKAHCPDLDCGESGSTLRFLIPIALAVAGGGCFTGRGRLMERPQTPYFEIFREKGIAFSQRSDTLMIKGSLQPGEYRLRGDVSSQFITGLLYALPLLPGDSRICLTTPLESSGYIRMTLDALETFGVKVREVPGGYEIPGGQTYRPAQAAVEADYSQAAFFYAIREMGSPITIQGMRPQSHQGDRVVLQQMAQLGRPGTVTLDVRECPDLVPALAARGAVRGGSVTKIVGAGRLRIKESDRLQAVTAVLGAMGAEILEEPEGLTIVGKDTLSGGVTVDAWGDHRIAMMGAVAATCCQNPVTITGAQSVRKSYPDFWADYRRLGGEIIEGETP